MDNVTDDEKNKIRISKKNDPAINLLILLDQVSSIVCYAVDLELQHLRITQPQLRVLTMLSRENRPVTLDELANWTIKRFHSVATLVNRMEKSGLVKKNKADTDSKTHITLTEKGDSFYHMKVTERSLRLIFGELTNEEMNQLESLLTKVRNTTRDLLGMDFKPPFLT